MQRDGKRQMSFRPVRNELSPWENQTHAVRHDHEKTKGSHHGGTVRLIKLEQIENAPLLKTGRKETKPTPNTTVDAR